MKVTRRASLALMGAAAGRVLLPRVSRADGELPCTGDRLDAALGAIARARRGLSTLSGPFTQTRSISLLASSVRSTGNVTLVLPDRLRWELDPPDAVVYWTTADGLAYRGPGGVSVVPASNARVGQALLDLRVVLGGDLATLRDRYDLAASCPAGGPMELRLAPRAPDARAVRELHLTLTPDLVTPRAVTLLEAGRDRTDILFGPLRVNEPVAPARMVPGAP